MTPRKPIKKQAKKAAKKSVSRRGAARVSPLKSAPTTAKRKAKKKTAKKKAVRRPLRNTVKKASPRRSGPRPAVTRAPAGKLRIQKFLADMGIASRRAVEEMILEQRVVVNEELVLELPLFIDPKKDVVKVDGRRIKPKHKKEVYFLVNKPRGVICSSSDPQGRRCVVDMLLPEHRKQRVYCVGRLDADSTGLIILTNDGELTQHLTHPSHEVPKTYHVVIKGKISGVDLDKIKRGVYLDGQRTSGAAVKVLRRSPEETKLEITLREGRNREIRRTLLRVGHHVHRLRRVAIGPITDRGLKIGNVRELKPKEVDYLKQTGRPE